MLHLKKNFIVIGLEGNPPRYLITYYHGMLMIEKRVDEEDKWKIILQIYLPILDRTIPKE